MTDAGHQQRLRFGTMFFDDPAAAARAVRRLREALAGHASDDGIWFDSRTWIITARRH
jgi:hypothetical protein